MLTALLLALLMQSPEFEWNVTETAPLDATLAMHDLAYGGADTRGLVGATHLGRGFYVTCRHLIVGRDGVFYLDGAPVDVEYLDDPVDFMLMRIKSKSDQPAADWSMRPILEGQKLTVMARLTGKVTGALHPKATTDGARKITLDPECKLTVSGDSGSPVLDARGYVVGVHVATVNGEHATRFVPLSLVREIMTKPFRGKSVPVR